MNNHLILSSLAFLILGGCGGETIPQVGSYSLDRNQFAPMLAEKLIDLGKAPATARAAIVMQLRSSEFNLELSEDGTFTADQHVLADERRYTGTWKLSGTTFRLDQTHEDGRPLPDHMTGTLVDGELRLRHQSRDGALDLVLHHAAVPAAPPR